MTAVPDREPVEGSVPEHKERETMSFRSGTDVLAADGDRIGVVRRVVVDPRTTRVTHLVVEKGFLFTEDRVLPIELVAEAGEDRLTLCRGIEDLEDLSEFEDMSYIPLDLVEPEPSRPGDDVRRLYWYPSRGTPWWERTTVLGHPVPIYVAHVEQHIPGGEVALEEGAEVVARDDEQVGVLEEVVVDRDSGRVTDIVVSHGLLPKTRRRVPTSWIEAVAEERVRLAVSAELYRRLPEL